MELAWIRSAQRSAVKTRKHPRLSGYKTGLALARFFASLPRSFTHFYQRHWSGRPTIVSKVDSTCTYVPDSEEDKCRREQESQHVTKGRECERHFFSGSASRFLARSADDAGSFATVSRFVSVSSSTPSGKLASILIVALLPSSGVVFQRSVKIGVCFCRTGARSRHFFSATSNCKGLVFIWLMLEQSDKHIQW